MWSVTFWIFSSKKIKQKVLLCHLAPVERQLFEIQIKKQFN